MKTTVVHHSADADGLFCREIARKFLPDAELIGWNFGDPLVPFPSNSTIYILDLPPECVEGLTACGQLVFPEATNLIWIDHHKSSIEKYRGDIPGYRIDGVAAARLCWQWFTRLVSGKFTDAVLPTKSAFVNREVDEPWAVRLAGEYDIFDLRDPNAELFQHGLNSEIVDFQTLLEWPSEHAGKYNVRLLNQGRAIQYAKTKENESIIKAAGFTVDFEGLRFLACNHARYNSFLFTAGLKPEHDACLGFAWKAGKWTVSLYHAPGKEHHDLSKIAVKYGGGGHRGACGMQMERLPWLP